MERKDRKAPPPLPLQGQPLAKTGMPSRRQVAPPQIPRAEAPRTAVPPAGTPLSPGQVVALVRDARKKAIADDENRPAAPDADGLKVGITLDLIGKNIPALPDEVVDILRNGVERLALSHNTLATLPVRFSQCTSLRYLAARNNAFETFPLPVRTYLGLPYFIPCQVQTAWF